MSQGIVQAAFTAGELSPSLQGRVDLGKYYTGAKTVRNFIVRQYGGVTNRPGSRLVGETKYSGAKTVAQIPFQFSSSQSYVLEFGHLYMRVVKEGGYIVDGSNNPIEFVTIFPESALPFLKYTQDADVMTLTHPDYPTQQLSRYSHTDWRFAAFTNVDGPFLDINVDKSVTLYVSATVGDSITITANSPIFTDQHIGRLLRIEQNPDDWTPKWEVQKVIAVNQVVRAGANWYQAAMPGTTGTVRPDHIEGSANDGNPGVVWNYLHSGYGTAMITARTDANNVTAKVIRRFPDSIIGGVSFSVSRALWNASTDDYFRFYCTEVFTVGEVVSLQWGEGVTADHPVEGVYTVMASGVADGYQYFGLARRFVCGYYDNSYTAGQLIVSRGSDVHSYKYAFAAWGGEQGYPSCSGYSQQRQLFAGSSNKPQNLWMSRIKGYLDFGVNIPVQDDDSISVTVASSQVNEIRHIVDLSKILLFTSAGIWAVSGTADGAMSPASVNAHRQIGDGCAHVRPLVVSGEALFISAKGQKVKAIGYNFAKDSFGGPDLTVLSSHLFERNQIVSWTYQEYPFSCVWCVRDDGVLLSLTYLPEQEVTAWSRHDTDGAYESVCCITEDGKDVVYAVVRRTIGGVDRRFIEQFADRQFSDITDAFFVDCGLSYDGVPEDTFSGLDHLEGKTVSILADGFVEPSQVVTDGKITLTRAYSKVHIGLPYIADLETLDVSIANSPVVAHQKLVHQVTALVQETVGFSAGPDANRLNPFKQRQDEDWGEPTRMLTDQVQLRVQTSWSKGGNLLIRQSDPLPITILALVPEVTVGGS